MSNRFVSRVTVSMALVLAGYAFCQGPETTDHRECSRAAEFLAAAPDREKAWGAYLAATCQLPGLTTEIVAQLDNTRPDLSGRSTWGDSHWAVNAMLDALIQLRQPLDASALTAIAKRFPTEAAILMLQDAHRNRALLAAIREVPVSRAVWIAVNNALARIRAPGFAAAVLREVSLTNSVLVLDSGGKLTGAGGSGILSNTSVRLPPGFPPTAICWLTAERTSGAELVSDGSTPVYSQRAVIDPGLDRHITFPEDAYCDPCRGNCPECEWLRAGYLAELAQIPEVEAHGIIHPQWMVEGATPAQVDEKITRALVVQEAGVKRLVRLLISVGALRNSELGMTFRIQVQIEDRRRDQSVSLPKYPAAEFHVSP